MMRTRRRSDSAALFFLLPAVFCLTMRAQQTPATEAAPQSKADVRFDFERPALQIPKFTLDVNEAGAGTYTAEDASTQPPQQIHREFLLTAATTRKIFALARAAHLSPQICASKARNVADTGKKQLTFSASGAVYSCTYNYSESKDVQALTDIFQGISETIDLGRRLDFLHRFDRLGLNDAIAFLNQEVSAGQALELGTIAPTLRSLASDAEVMQRVRSRAAALLALIPAEDSTR